MIPFLLSIALMLYAMCCLWLFAISFRGFMFQATWDQKSGPYMLWLATMLLSGFGLWLSFSSFFMLPHWVTSLWTWFLPASWCIQFVWHLWKKHRGTP